MNGLYGFRVVTSRNVPEGKWWIFHRPHPTIVVRPDPTPVEAAFREARRFIARECPLSAPPEWASLQPPLFLAGIIAKLNGEVQP